MLLRRSLTLHERNHERTNTNAVLERVHVRVGNPSGAG